MSLLNEFLPSLMIPSNVVCRNNRNSQDTPVVTYTFHNISQTKPARSTAVLHRIHKGYHAKMTALLNYPLTRSQDSTCPRDFSLTNQRPRIRPRVSLTNHIIS